MTMGQFMHGAKLTLNALGAVLRMAAKALAWTFGILAVVVLLMTRMW